MNRIHQKRVSLITLLLTCSLLLIALSVSLTLRISGKDQPLTGKALEYCRSLEDAGFPEDYAILLTKLHLLHPDWEFVPLNVTASNSKYTWNYVISQETKKPDINLVPAGSSYKAYHHPTNTSTYDSGYLQPSTAAVEYFMDPRNFLNECDIFQFYDLNVSANISSDAVYAVLDGTFMSGADVGNGMTYAEYLLQTGKEIGVDPAFLAVRLRQEQGVAGTSPVISGNCGSLLWTYYRDQVSKTSSGLEVNPPASGRTEQELLALNGYYNPFNINATVKGSGVFSIYENAMKYAKNKNWDTLAKGIRGGAEMIKKNYIDQKQSTFYLQKFDVNGSFAHQYMQSLSGAMSEARTLYQSFASIRTLDAKCRFLIPVYEDMPENICKDPAGGNCSFFAAATTKYSTTAKLTFPFKRNGSNDMVYGVTQLTKEEILTVSGQFTHSYGIRRLEYTWDGGEWHEISVSASGTIDLAFSGNLPDYGEHILVIRGEANYNETDSQRKANYNFLCTVLEVTVIPPPSVTLTLQSGNAVSRQKYYEGTQIALPACDEAEFAGWVGSDGTVLPSGASLILQSDVSYRALFLHLTMMEGAALSTAKTLRFSAALPANETAMLDTLPSNTCRILARMFLGGAEQTAPDVKRAAGTVENKGSWCVFYADSATLPSRAAWDADISAEFYAEIYYSDGTKKNIPSSGTPSVRSAYGIASAALNDSKAGYSPAVRKILDEIAPIMP